jgi:tricorn protease
MVNTDGTGLEELPIHEICQGSFSPTESGSPTTRPAGIRTWKRYKGGRAQDVYVYDFETKKNERITDFEGTDRIPMWIGDKIYFASDRDNVLNIYAYDTKTKTTEQLTRHRDYDAGDPAKAAAVSSMNLAEPMGAGRQYEAERKIR